MNNLTPVTAVALTLSCLILASTLPAQETTETKIIPITVHLLVDEDGAAADPEAIDRWISQASEHFANVGVAFKGEIVREKVPSADVNSVLFRNSLVARSAWDGTIHLFVARRVADKDKEGGWIAGVHWRYWGMVTAKKKQHCIILSASDCGVDTLAHELGHFFGEAHTDDPENLMNGSGRHAGAKFSENQIMRIASEARKMIAGTELRPVAPDIDSGGKSRETDKRVEINLRPAPELTIEGSSNIVTPIHPRHLSQVTHP